jgi:hypothetical protein
MKIDKIFFGLFLSISIMSTYGCEKSGDKKAEQEAGQAERHEVGEVKSLTGTWHLTSSDGDSGPLEVRQFGNDIVGTFRGTNNPKTLFAISGTRKGEVISLEFSQGTDVIVTYEGKVTGEKMSGTWTDEGQSGTWEATKR